MTKSIPRIILSHIAGFIIFLILLAVANILIPSINNDIYINIIQFFNSNLIFLLLLTFIGMINEIFWSFYFPFNIFAPIFSSILSIYVITFIYKIWSLLDVYIKSTLIIPIDLIYAIVPLIVFIAGYITIIARHGKPAEEWHRELKEMHKNRLERKRDKLKIKLEKVDKKLGKNKVEWEDVGDEFRLAFYNLGKSFNELFDKKNNKKKKFMDLI